MLEHFFDELELNTNNDKAAFISLNGSLTYRDLIKKINIIINYLQTNIAKNKLIAIIQPNSIETCVLILACLKYKIPFVSIDASFPSTEINKILLQLKPSYIIADHFKHEAQPEITVISTQLILNTYKPAYHNPTLYPNNNEAFIALTSGSTGIVKGVVHTNYSLCEAISHVLASLQIETSHRLLCTISHTSNAFLRNMLACLIKGATFILGHHNDFNVIINLIVNHSPTHIRFSIKDLITFAQLNITDKKHLTSIKRCDVSGDVIPESIIDGANHLLENCSLITSYAMSECSTIAMNTMTHNKKYQSLTGKIMPGVLTHIVDDDNNEIKNLATGELYIKSSTLFKYYLHDEAETAHAFTSDGWFKTGDYFSRNHDGYLIFQGRKKNIIIKDGKNINPQYIKDTILAWPDILDCAVLSQHSDTTLQEPVAYCVAHNDNIKVEAFKKYLQDNLNKIYLPKSVYIIKHLPRTPFGKIDISFIKNNTQYLNNEAYHHINL